MSRVKTNFVANLAGSGWAALIGLACTPLYIRFMGMEAYGLVGFYIMMQSVIQILDLGLSPTMNREMARYSILPNKGEEMRDFVRTLEIGYWSIGLLIGASILLATPYIASHWIKASDMSLKEIQRAVAIMGVLAALQWPLSFYHGGLLGLQRQVLLNGILIATSSLASGGAVFILWRVSPTVTAFFLWQVGTSLLQVILITWALWSCLPSTDRPARINIDLVKNMSLLGFAAGMSGITITALVLTQLDKVILSKILPLKIFGYYILACVVGNGLTVLITPVFNTVFPRFSALVAEKNGKALLDMYHGSTQVMAVLILPAASLLALFSYDIIALWTGSEEIAKNTAPIVSILVIGTAFNGMMNLPYALQLANGWTRIGFTINCFFLLILVPAIYSMANYYGAVGAAIVWAALNVTYMAVGVPLTHRRLLKGEAFHWFLKDVGLPMAAALLVAGIGRKLIPYPLSPTHAVFAFVLLWACSTAATALAAPESRSWITRRKILTSD